MELSIGDRGVSSTAHGARNGGLLPVHMAAVANLPQEVGIGGSDNGVI